MFSNKHLVVVVTALLFISSVFAVAIPCDVRANEAIIPQSSVQASPTTGIEETPEASPSASSEPTPEELAQIDAQLYKTKAIAWRVKVNRARVRLAWLRMALAMPSPKKLISSSQFDTWQSRYEYCKNRVSAYRAKCIKLRCRINSIKCRPIYGIKLKHYIVYVAKKCGVDPAATLAVVCYEGKFSGGVGDGGTSFGPWSLHRGGALPRSVSNPRRWANSPAGIQYALRAQAKIVRNSHGFNAIHEIVWRFERPQSPSYCVQLAWSYHPAMKCLVAKYLRHYQVK